MGYSCTLKADKTLQTLMSIIGKGEKSSNTWIHNGNKYFYEIGKENSDGAITGTIYRVIKGDDSKCLKTGSFRIDADGKIVRFPTTTSQQRNEAEKVNASFLII